MERCRFPNKLKMFRRCSGYSQKKVARLIGLCDTSTLSRWEHGMTYPNLVQAFHIARIYKTEPHELFKELWNQFDSIDKLLTQDESIKNNQTFHL